MIGLAIACVVIAAVEALCGEAQGPRAVIARAVIIVAFLAAAVTFMVLR